MAPVVLLHHRPERGMCSTWERVLILRLQCLTMTDNSSQDPQARRREQIRLAQRRRRERLAQGSRTQVSVFLSSEALARLDALALLWGVERQDVIERLLSSVQVETVIPDAKPNELGKTDLAP